MTKGRILRVLGGGLLGYGLGVVFLSTQVDIRHAMIFMVVGCALGIFGMGQK
jgi:hypothetical protein